MGRSAQSGTELLSTFGIALLIIAIAIAVLLIFASAPAQTLPTSCSIYGTVKCSDVAYGTNTLGVTTLVILASSQVQGTINISSFHAIVGGVKSTSGYCSSNLKQGGSSVILQGQSIYCVATFPNNVILSQIYSGTFNITGNYCSGTKTCSASTSPYSFSGSFSAHATAISLTTTSSTISSSTTSTSSTSTTSSTTTSSTSTSTTTSSTTTILCSPGGVGPWNPTTPYVLSGGITLTSCASSSTDIYCVGGISGSILGDSSPVSNVYYAPISANGVGNWISTTSYPMAVERTQCLVSNGHIYCMGGEDSSYFPTGSVYYAPISTSGVGSWTSTTSYPNSQVSGLPFGNPICSISNGYIYCVAEPDAGTDSVYYTTVNGNGMGAWHGTTLYPECASDVSCTTSNNYLTCLGGGWNCASGYGGPTNTNYNGDSVYSAQISSGGVGNWISSNAFPVSTSAMEGTIDCPIINGYIICAGGDGQTVYSAPISGNGIVGVWNPTSTYAALYDSCTTSNNYIYCVGGEGSLSPNAYNSVYYAPICSGPLFISLSPLSKTITAGQSVTFTNITTGGTPPYAFAYSTNALSYSTAGNGITFNTAGTYSVVESVTDGAGHTAYSQTATITVTPLSYYDIYFASYNAIYLVNSATNTILNTITLPIIPGAGTTDMGISGNHRQLYIGSWEPDQTFAINTITNTLSNTIYLRPYTFTSGCCSESVSPSGGFVYALSFGSSPSGTYLFTINAITNVPTRNTLLSSTPYWANAALTPNGNYLYTPDQNLNQVDVVNTATGAVATIPLSSEGYGINITQNGQYVYVGAANFQQPVNNLIYSISTATNLVVNTINLSPLSVFPSIITSPNGQYGYLVYYFKNNVPSEGVAEFYTSNGQIINQLSFPLTRLWGEALTPDGKYLYVTGYTPSMGVALGGQMFAINTNTFQVTNTISVLSNSGTPPSPIIISPP